MTCKKENFEQKKFWKISCILLNLPKFSPSKFLYHMVVGEIFGLHQLESKAHMNSWGFLYSFSLFETLSIDQKLIWVQRSWEIFFQFSKSEISRYSYMVMLWTHDSSARNNSQPLAVFLTNFNIWPTKIYFGWPNFQYIFCSINETAIINL